MNASASMANRGDMFACPVWGKSILCGQAISKGQPLTLRNRRAADKSLILKSINSVFGG
jgi:hypothetical protein